MRALAAVGVLCAAASILHAQQRFEVFATIVDANGAAVAGVAPGDLRVADEAGDATVVSVAPIRWPLAVQLLVDNGAGLASQNLVALRNGMQGFLEALPPEAQVTIVTMAPQPRFLLRAGNGRDALESLGRLSPDEGAGRFVDALKEATERIERDRAETFSVIVAVATTVGDNDPMERDVNRTLDRLQKRPTTVDVVLYSGDSRRTTNAGANQTQIGLAVTKLTNGRYEAIAAPTRLATLLPEIGDHIARSYLDGRVRIAFTRAGGASGEPQRVSLATREGLKASAVSFDARLP